ncbi:TPA: hypothetical protein ACK3JH_002163 [Mannheimia haemolytica]
MMLIEELNELSENCYEFAFFDDYSENLIITFSPTSSFFLYNRQMNAKKLCIISNQPNYYLLNPGSTCKLIAKFIQTIKVKNIILLGSSKAGFASILWADLLKRVLNNKKINIFSLAFSPQTKLYPCNKNLGFPSYKKFFLSLESDYKLKKCAETYGNLAEVLKESALEGLIIYPSEHYTDREEALRLENTHIVLKSISSPIHGTIFPFMSDVTRQENAEKLVNKLYQNADNDSDLKSTLPNNPENLVSIITKIRTPSLEELCRSIFLYMENKRAYSIIKEFNLI